MLNVIRQRNHRCNRAAAWILMSGNWVSEIESVKEKYTEGGEVAIYWWIFVARSMLQSSTYHNNFVECSLARCSRHPFTVCFRSFGRSLASLGHLCKFSFFAGFKKWHKHEYRILDRDSGKSKWEFLVSWYFFLCRY